MSKQYPNGFPFKVEATPLNNHCNYSQMENTIYKIPEGRIVQGKPPLEEEKGGYLWTVYDKHNVNCNSPRPLGQSGCQYFFSSTGNVWRRTGEELGHQTGLTYATRWNNWEQITTKVIDLPTKTQILTLQSKIDQSIKMYDVEVNNANNVDGDFSGYYRTTRDCREIDSVVGNDKSGILQHLKHTVSGNKMQLYVPISGSYAGVPFLRTSNGVSGWNRWINMRSMIEDKYIKKPENDTVVDNMNNITSTSIRKTTPNNTTDGNMPSQIGNEANSKNGILSTYSSDNGGKYQIYVPTNGTHKGRIYIRAKEGKDQDFINDWREIHTKESVRWEWGTPQDLNTITYGESYLVRVDTTDGGRGNNKPPNTSERGTLIWLSAGQSRGTQLYFDSENGKGYSRFRNQSHSHGQFSEWKELGGQGQAQEGTFEHHTEIPDNNIKNITKSGYYFTNTTTQGLPDGLDEESKEGVLKVLKSDDNDLVYRFTPAKGKQAGYIFKGALPHTMLLDADPIHWDKVAGTDGHTKIHDTRNTKGAKPKEYYVHSNWDTGYVMYEWKWGSDIGLGEGSFDPPIKANKDIILQTIVPDEKGLQEGASLVSQLAYVIADDRQFWRKANDSKGNDWRAWEETTVKDRFDRKLDKPEYLEEVGNVDLITTSGIYKTGQSSSSLPLPLQIVSKEGILTNYVDNKESSIVQYWTPTSDLQKRGTFWVRVKSAGGWQGWNQIGSGGGAGGDAVTEQELEVKLNDLLNKVVTIPELNTVSINNRQQNGNLFPNKSGVYRTEPTSENYPHNEEYGIVEYYFQNMNNNTCIQRWTCLTGSNQGKVYVRSINNGQSESTNWIELLNSSITQETVKGWFKTWVKEMFDEWKDLHESNQHP